MASKKNQKKGAIKGKRSESSLLRSLTAAAGLLFGQKALAGETDAQQEEALLPRAQSETSQSEKADELADATAIPKKADDEPELADADQPAEEVVADAEGTEVVLDDELLALREQLSDGGLATDAPVENMDLVAQADAASGSSAEGGSAAGDGAAEASATTGAEGAAAFTLSPLAGIGFGALGLGLVASGGGGGGSGGSTPAPTPAPTPDPVLPVVEKASGKVVDGAVKDAKVFYDANGNGKLDAGEVWTTTDGEGRFTLEGFNKTANGKFVVEAGGIDTFTGQKVGAMSAGAGYTSINPFTTLLSNGNVDAEALLAKLGLTDLDLNNYDPVAMMKSADATPEQKALAQKAFTIGQQINSVIQSAAQLKGRAEGDGVDGTEVADVAAAMAQAIISGSGDAAALINQATGAALDAALVNNTDPSLDTLKDKLATALINVNEEIADAYAGLGDALANGNAAAIVGAAAIAAISQSALSNAVVNGNTGLLDTLADDNALGTLTDTYESALGNLNGGVYTISGTATVIDGKLAIAPDLLENAASVTVTDAMTLDQATRLVKIEDVSFDVNTLQSMGTATVGYSDVALVVNAGLEFTAGDVITAAVGADQIAAAAARAAQLGASGIDHLSGTAPLTISDAAAASLASGGLDFTDVSDVTLDAADKRDGTLSASLKDLQKLKVDQVMMTGAAGAVAVDLGSDADLNGSDLPTFADQLDVTLGFDASQIAEVAGNAAALDNAGIDYLNVNGGVLDNLHITQANALLGNDNTYDAGDLRFVDGNDITLAMDQGDLAAVIAAGDGLRQLGVDQLHADAITLSGADASALITAGLAFDAASEDVTLNAGGGAVGTVLSNSLKDLQKLGVDAVGGTAGAAIGIQLGAGDALAGGLPAFDADLNVTLGFDASQIAEVAGNAAALKNAGIDSIDINDNTLSDLHITQAQALLGGDSSFDSGDLAFAANDDVTLAFDQNDLASVIGAADALVSLGVDQLHAGAITLSDADASALIGAGLAFDDASDAVALNASGTVLSNSLKDLQKLGVDAVGGAGVLNVNLGAGAALAGGLPQFDDAMQVNLRIDNSQLDEVLANVQHLTYAGIDTIDLNGDTLSNLHIDQAQALLGNDSSFDAGDLAFATNDDVTLAMVQGDLANVVGAADALVSLGVDQLHAGAITLSDADASALIGAGLAFDDASDAVALNASGSVLSNSLKDLQKLGVDAVGGAGVLNLNLGAGAALAGGLPQFDDAMQVNLGINDDQLGEVLANAQQLKDAGIDTVSFNDGTGSIDLAGLHAFVGGDGYNPGEDLAFKSSDDITLVGNSGLVAGLEQAAYQLQDIGIDHLQFGSATIDATQAAVLVDAGLDFVASDDVTLDLTNAEGTHLSNSLKDLQKLGVDAVSGAAGMHVAVDLGQGFTDFGGLPRFADDLNVTLNVDASQYSDIAGHIDALRGAGIDDIRLHGTQSELDALNLSGDTSYFDGITLDVADANALDSLLADTSALAGLGDIGGVRIDKLDVANGGGGAAELNISDAAAAALIDAGLSFEANDNVVLNVGTAHGTLASTKFDDLQKLGVDEVMVKYDSPTPVVDTRDEMVNVDAVDSYDHRLDVTLDIDDRYMPQGADAQAAFQQLKDKGIDHVAVSDSFDLLSDDALAELAGITNATGIDFELQLQSGLGTANLDQQLQGIDLLSGYTTADKYGDLVAALSDSGVHNLVLESGTVQVSDALAATLIDAGMLEAAAATELALDATQSNGFLHTSLKEMADLGVDTVTGSSGKVYIDLGIQSDTNALEEIKALLGSFDNALFGPGSSGALVLDNKVASAISHDGVIDSDVLAGLSNLGITEIDVLVASGQDGSVVAQTMPQVPVEVKLIGQDVDAMLFDELHKPYK